MFDIQGPLRAFVVYVSDCIVARVSNRSRIRQHAARASLLNPQSKIQSKKSDPKFAAIASATPLAIRWLLDDATRRISLRTRSDCSAIETASFGKEHTRC